MILFSSRNSFKQSRMIFKVKLVKSVFLLLTAGHIFLHQSAVLVQIIRVKWMYNYNYTPVLSLMWL